jgi:single-strand DNA-binding protein
MNSVTLIGNLTRDPEMKENGGTKICQLRVAESNGSKSKEDPVFIDVAAFGRQAETCGQYLSKGRHVAVSGRLRFREWDAKDGSRRSEHSVVADRVQFLPGGPQRRRQSPSSPLLRRAHLRPPQWR